ncbi:MAG TPA: class I SAM-dependent methyltransferase [Edaphobacter sp.]|nr:class I SAM-dependent methyltransferase [Edaphobacter sp.]
MASYDTFGKFYDAIMGDRAEATECLREFIRKECPEAKNILELGCGTGSVLMHLAKDYQVSGLDQSKKMLSVARKKVPQARLFNQDMVRFNLPEKFDVICCVFDSINHVLSFAGWKELFASVSRHLSDGGIFIFDVNTQKKLDQHIAGPAWVHPFGNNLVIIKVGDAPNHASNWNIRVFEHTKGSRYLLHEENIQEASFPKDDIVNALKVKFRKVKVIDTDRNRPSFASERLYFLCKK